MLWQEVWREHRCHIWWFMGVGRLPVDPTRKAAGSLSASSLGGGESGLLGSARSEETFSDEYDPARPNEYEAVRKDKERLREEAQQEADRQDELRLLQVFVTHRAHLWHTTEIIRDTPEGSLVWDTRQEQMVFQIFLASCIILTNNKDVVIGILNPPEECVHPLLQLPSNILLMQVLC